MSIVIDSKTGRRWSQENVRRVYDRFRHETIAALRARDEARGVSGELGKRDDKGRLILSADKIAQRHTGAEETLLTQARWERFRSEPQNEDDWEKTLAAEESAERLKTLERQAAPLISTLPLQAQEAYRGKLRDDDRPAGQVRKSGGARSSDG